MQDENANVFVQLSVKLDLWAPGGAFVPLLLDIAVFLLLFFFFFCLVFCLVFFFIHFLMRDSKELMIVAYRTVSNCIHEISPSVQ